MNPTLHDLKQAAAGLPAPERAALAQFLMRSLEPEGENWAEAWREELESRLTDIRSGKEVGVPEEGVRSRLRERYP